jgi:hypothetical protein
MSFKVTRLTVGKGKTTGNEKESVWTRQYYEVEATIEDEHHIESAKESIETLLDTWLKGELINKPQPPLKKEAKNYDIEKIAWTDAEGSSGPYQRSEDVNSLDFKTLLKDLQEHGGKFRKNGYFLWVFRNGATIGRKKVK